MRNGKLTRRSRAGAPSSFAEQASQLLSQILATKCYYSPAIYFPGRSSKSQPSPLSSRPRKPKMLHVCTCRMPTTTLTLLAKHRILTRPHPLLAHRLCSATLLHQPVRNNHAAGGQNFRPERIEYANLVSKSLRPGEREEVKPRFFDRRRTSKGKDPLTTSR